MGLYVLLGGLIEFVAQPIAVMSRSIPPGFWSNFLFQFSDYLKVLFQTPCPWPRSSSRFLSLLVVEQGGRPGANCLDGRVPESGGRALLRRPAAGVDRHALHHPGRICGAQPARLGAGGRGSAATDRPIHRRGVGDVGGDAQYTFRKVTLPLILPALLAGLIFSFTRHMTSLSAIIFLISARWRIVTASILSEWEQGGISIAAAYSTVIIVLVLIAIGILYYCDAPRPERPR